MADVEKPRLHTQNLSAGRNPTAGMLDVEKPSLHTQSPGEGRN